MVRVPDELTFQQLQSLVYCVSDGHDGAERAVDVDWIGGGESQPCAMQGQAPLRLTVQQAVLLRIAGACAGERDARRCRCAVSELDPRQETLACLCFDACTHGIGIVARASALLGRMQ